MFPFPDNLYARWRAQRNLAPALREDESSPPESLLQAVWRHQRLRREQLTTLDGRTVRILHPGFLSREGGPDFRGAVVQFADEPPVTGDIEVDLQSAGWRAHGHDKNAAFKNVILHVLWKATPSPLKNATPPAVVINGKLDAPLAELNLWLNSEESETLPEKLRGQCSAPLGELAPEKLRGLLWQAAHIRFHSKAAQFQARARHVGWNKLCGKVFFARWVTSTIPGPCSAWRKAASAGLRRAVRHFHCRRACSALRVCCRQN